jgi:hypothetical protein
MSGTDDTAAEPAAGEQQAPDTDDPEVSMARPASTQGSDALAESLVGLIRPVLAGERPLDTKGAVATALAGKPNATVEPSRIAFGLDANIILKLHNRATEADFLTGRHGGVLIMPSQAIQEFWNNKSSTQSVAEKVKSAYLTLERVIADLDPEHQEFKDGFAAALETFEKSAGHLWAPDFRAKVASTFSSLAARAREPRFPKLVLADVARERQLTKTPPGFKDNGNGDLYVWAEFLLGLLEAKRDGDVFDLAVLVTEDKKSDWGKGGEAHPVLIAELWELVGVPFETWDLGRLQRFAADAVS